ncbi:hypothetical protein BD413DRAFT_615810 [Trametes elegans]|nr:hypothetical protein BD413DRAFT_615810 [Trametes elegans]
MHLDLALRSLHPLKAVKRIEIDFPRQLFTLSNDTLLNALTSWASLATFSLTFNDSYPVPPNPEKRLDHVALFEIARRCPEIVHLTLSGVDCSAVGRNPLDPRLYESLPAAGHDLERLVLLNLRNTNVFPLARMLSQVFPRLDSSPPPGMKPEWYMDNLFWGLVMSALHVLGGSGPQ